MACPETTGRTACRRIPGSARRLNRLVAVVLVLLVSAALVPAQSTNGSDGGESMEPAPYTEDEFPRWLRDLRRFEVIAVGTFPAALLVTNLGYSLYRFVSASIEAGSVTGESVPGVLGFGAGQTLEDEERRRVITVAVSLSASVAVLDWILGRLEDRRAP